MQASLLPSRAGTVVALLKVLRGVTVLNSEATFVAVSGPLVMAIDNVVLIA